LTFFHKLTRLHADPDNLAGHGCADFAGVVVARFRLPGRSGSEVRGDADDAQLTVDLEQDLHVGSAVMVGAAEQPHVQGWVPSRSISISSPGRMPW
jgi:hypothetical protein